MGEEYKRRVDINSDIGANILTDIYEDFEGANLSPWSGGGTGSPTVTVSTAKAYSGAQSAKMQTRSLTPAAGDTATLSRSIAIREAKFVRFGFLYMLDDTPDTDMNVRLLNRIEASNNDYRLNFDESTDEIQILQADGTYVTITTDFDLEVAYWLAVELRINLADKKYDKLKVANKVYDISAYQPRTQDNQGDQGHFQATITITTIVAQQSAPLYFDKIYLLYE